MVGRGWMGLAVVGIWAVTACSGSESQGTIRQSALVAPEVVEGNPTCPEGYVEFKIDPPGAGTYAAGDGFEVEIGYTDDYLWFDANQGVDIVIVKGGPNANVYAYDPEVSEDEGLVTPTNPNNGKPYGYSHVTFCYDEDEALPLEIDKTAETHQRYGWDWDIDKGGYCPEISFNGPYSFLSGFWVNLTATPVAGDWVTSGTITIHNPNLADAVIVDVEDLLDGVEVDVDCGGAVFPYVLGAGDDLVCTYEATTGAAPEENTATVYTDPEGPIAGDTVTVPVVQVTNGIATEDDCVAVYDQFEDRAPVLLDAEVCVGDLVEGAITIEYQTLIEEDTCGEYWLENRAWFVTDDTETTEDDTFTTHLRVKCPEPCPTEPQLNAICQAQRSAELAALGTCSGIR